MELSSAKLVEVLRATLNPDLRADAEKQLEGACQEDGFVPILLHFVMSEDLDMSVKQAGVVYMKNTVVQYWDEMYRRKNSFIINDRDKQIVRENIVQAILTASNLIRLQLAVCVQTIIRCDYPNKWPALTGQLISNLQSDRHSEWLGSLICLHQLVKAFEYKGMEEKKPLNDAMSSILPVIHRIGCLLLNDQSEPAARVQMQILKVFYAHIQFCLPLNWITRTHFTEWMELVRSIADFSIPEECNKLHNEEKTSSVWWKSKKWALNILTRCFERYGSPGNVQKDYTDFADWFLKTFSGPLILLMLKFLDMYRNGVFVSDRVLQLSICFVTQGVNHAFSWKVIKVHVNVIVRDIIFPLLCHSNEDDELWTNDPVEYIRTKYNVYEEFFNPSSAAQSFLSTAAANRRNLLDETMNFLDSAITSTKDLPKQKSGVLQMLGTLAATLIQKKRYKSLLEGMLVTHVCPEFTSTHGYLRARACWVISCFSKLKYKDSNNLTAVLGVVCEMLHSDKDLPVRVEAALALQDLITDHDVAQDILRPSITQIVGDLLSLIRDTEHDELASALQKFVCQFSEDIAPLAVEVTKHLADTFICIMDSSVDADTSDSKSMAIMGILSTMETVCTVMEDNAEVLQQIEDVVSSVIIYILQNEMLEYFEEVLSLVSSLTSQQISLRMWIILPLLSKQLYPGNLDYFTDMMPCLHNYIVVGGANFLSHQPHVELVFSMCKTVLIENDASDHVECHAAKLLETILLQYRGGPVDHLVLPFIELALSRLQRPIAMMSLRTSLINIIIAALLHNPSTVVALLDRPLAGASCSILTDVIRHWLGDHRGLLGLHDKKMFVIGLCTLLSIPADCRPQVVTLEAARLLPALLTVFKGVKRAYELRSHTGEPWHRCESDLENTEHEDEEDIINENKRRYQLHMEKLETEGDTEGDDVSGVDEETTLECYETMFDTEPYIDEYIMFAAVLHNIAVTDQAFYQLVIAPLDENDLKELGECLLIASERKLRLESQGVLSSTASAATAAAMSGNSGAGDGPSQ